MRFVERKPRYRATNEAASDAEVQAAFKKADKDGDGKLSFEEFVLWAFEQVEDEAA